MARVSNHPKLDCVTVKVAKPDASVNTTSHTLWVAVCLLIGVVLRLYRLDAQSLWSDEGIQYFIASADSVWDVRQRARDHTFHPPALICIE